MPVAVIPACEQERLSVLANYALLQESAAHETLQRYAKLAAFVLGTPNAAVSLVGRDQQHLAGRFGIVPTRTPRDHAFCSYTILQQQALVVTDAFLDARFKDNPLVTGDPGIRFYAGAPLTSPEGMSIGALCGFDTTPRIISGEQAEALCILATGLMTTLNLLRSSQRMHKLALTDALTGLPNRISFAEALSEATAALAVRQVTFSLVYIDCDHFKRLNDTEGHEAGDNLLRLLSGELRDHVRSTDLPARLGGDEFAVLLPDTDAAEAQATAGRFLKHFRAVARAARWNVSLSIGVATFRGDRVTLGEAMGAADAAMYNAKRGGRDRVAVVVVQPVPLSKSVRPTAPDYSAAGVG